MPIVVGLLIRLANSFTVKTMSGRSLERYKHTPTAARKKVASPDVKEGELSSICRDVSEGVVCERTCPYLSLYIFTSFITLVPGIIARPSSTRLIFRFRKEMLLPIPSSTLWLIEKVCINVGSVMPVALGAKVHHIINMNRQCTMFVAKQARLHWKEIHVKLVLQETSEEPVPTLGTEALSRQILQNSKVRIVKLDSQCWRLWHLKEGVLYVNCCKNMIIWITLQVQHWQQVQNMRWSRWWVGVISLLQKRILTSNTSAPSKPTFASCSICLGVIFHSPVIDIAQVYGYTFWRETLWVFSPVTGGVCQLRGRTGWGSPPVAWHNSFSTTLPWCGRLCHLAALLSCYATDLPSSPAHFHYCTFILAVKAGLGSSRVAYLRSDERWPLWVLDTSGVWAWVRRPLLLWWQIFSERTGLMFHNCMHLCRAIDLTACHWSVLRHETIGHCRKFFWALDNDFRFLWFPLPCLRAPGRGGAWVPGGLRPVVAVVFSMIQWLL